MRRLSFVLLILLSAGLFAAAQQEGQLTIWAKPNYGSWENPLHTELSVNGELLDIFTAETDEAIPLKSGWNTISLKTTPQQTERDNDLVFRIGPMQEEGGGKGKKGRKVMQPVLWRFRNGTDWKFQNGQHSHPLGPNTKEVTLTYKVYYAGLDREDREIKEGDYILQGKPNYDSWNTPVVATVWVNGTPLNSFMLERRAIVITDLLRPGKNEIKIVSARVKDSISDNDILFDVLGPAEWNVTENRFTFTPVLNIHREAGLVQGSEDGAAGEPRQAGVR